MEHLNAHVLVYCYVYEWLYVWFQVWFILLQDYQRELAEKHAQLGHYRKAREALESALDCRPPVLDPEDERIGLISTCRARAAGVSLTLR